MHAAGTPPNKFFLRHLMNLSSELRRPGAATFPYNMYLLAKGEKSPTEVAQSVATPQVLSKAAIEVATNRDWRTGRGVYDPHADWRTIGSQLEHKGAESLSPVQYGERLAQGSEQAKRTGLGFLGVSMRKHGAEAIARDIAFRKMGTQAPTPESLDLAAIKVPLRMAAEKGEIKPAQDALRRQEITRQQFAHLNRVAHGLGLLDTVKGFSYPEVKQVWDAATPAERKQLRPALVRSASHALETMPVAQRRGLITEVRAALQASR